ncbi:hypothetical protein [Mycetocola sp. JXN-3]|uniref:hypothetical protein n=1 Tax=Mycetocola sp. JXN-3 TaxID=2116510 RepID=UPI00165CEE89|nr:hypothetical protein [Mycetocola sp. JXN-3]
MTPLNLVLIVAFVVGVFLLVGLAARWFRKHPNRAKKDPGRIRMPKNVPILGWPVLVVSVLGFLMSFVSTVGESNAIPMRIAFGLLSLLGIFLVMMYRNWYVKAGTDSVEFRTIFGVRHSFLYSEISSYVFHGNFNQTQLTVRGPRRETLGLSITQYDVSPMIAAINFHQQNGRWPFAGEPR